MQQIQYKAQGIAAAGKPGMRPQTSNQNYKVCVDTGRLRAIAQEADLATALAVMLPYSLCMRGHLTY